MSHGFVGRSARLGRSAFVLLLALGALPLAGPLAPAGAQAQTTGVGDDFTQQLSFALARNAKSFCSGVFVIGRSAEDTFNSADLQRWETLVDWYRWANIAIDVDLEGRKVTLTQPPAPPRTAVYNGVQGCTILPPGESAVYFRPLAVTPALPPADETAWPMGDVTEGQRIQGIDRAAVERALAIAFEENTGERAWVVLHEGKIVAERYAPDHDRHTRTLNFSMGKSLTSTLIGILVRDGHFEVTDPAPIAEWAATDARSLITIENLLHMSGGLDCNSFGLSQPNHFTWDNHHAIVYNEGIDVFEMAVSRPLLYVPGMVNRYRNCDTMVLGKIVRETVEREYDIDYLAFPQRALFDRIGARGFVLETDPHGNLVMSGHNYATVRDWARVGQLFLQDGVWNGERVLPAGWVEFATRPSPANAGYGAQWWLATPRHGLPPGTYWASGAEGQTMMVIPTHDVVISMAGFSPSTDRDQLAREIAAAVIRSEGECGGAGWRRFGFESEGECIGFMRR